MKNRLIWIGLLALAGSHVANAQAVTFTSFLPGDVFNSSAQGIAITGPSDPSPVIAGFQFTSNLSGSLAGIRLPISQLLGNSDLTVSFFSDASDHVGSLMKSWTISDSVGWHIASLVNDDNSIVLDAGAKYWITLSASGNGVHFWGQSAQNGLMMSGYQFNNDGIYHYGNTDVFPAYEVQVNTTPEPGTMVFATAACLGLYKRRRKS